MKSTCRVGTVELHSCRYAYEARPWTLNQERRMHRMERARLARTFRTAFWAVGQRTVPEPIRRARIRVETYLADGRLCDADAVHPAAKAALDGLVDAKVLIDDGPDVVREIIYVAPQRRETTALELVVEEMP